MKKLALNFICKNEGHIIERMLSSARPVIDMIVCVDTGSTDNTIELILAFGKQHHIPTFVYERPFDNFCNSRNYALDMLRGKVQEMNWDLSEVYGFCMDCDETLKPATRFKKQALTADVYIIRLTAGQECFTRQVFYRLDRPVYWEGPIHETITWTDKAITREIIPDLEILVEPVGASWKGDLVAKFLRYAEVLREYVESGHRVWRWIFYVGDSYSAAASYATDSLKKKELHERARVYYDQALTVEPEGTEGMVMLYSRLGENSKALGYTWPMTKQYYLKAFTCGMNKAESLATIIEHYMAVEEWHLSYLFAKFSYQHFTAIKGEQRSIFYTNESLYNWKLLYYYYLSAYKNGHPNEARELFKGLKRKIKEHPDHFRDKDLLLIKLSSPQMIKVNKAMLYLKKLILRPAWTKPGSRPNRSELMEQPPPLNIKYS